MFTRRDFVDFYEGYPGSVFLSTNDGSIYARIQLDQHDRVI